MDILFILLVLTALYFGHIFTAVGLAMLFMSILTWTVLKDDGVSLKRKDDYDKRITRKEREPGHYLVLPTGEHKISIGYLRISEMPALEALLKTFLLANNNRFEVRR